MVAGEADDIVYGQEVGREAELLDELEFVLDLRAHLAGQTLRIALGGTLPGETNQLLLRRAAFRDRVDRIFVAQLVELNRQRSAISTVRAMASGYRANSRAISSGGFRWRSALA